MGHYDTSQGPVSSSSESYVLADVLRLKELDLTGCTGLTVKSVELLAEHRDISESLTSLSLKNCQDLDQTVMLALCSRFTNLQSLDVSNMRELRDNDVKLLRCLQDLRVLRCGNERLTGSWLEILARLPELTELDLQGSRLISEATFATHLP
eukprot:scaffold670443_cov53-Prasinocladus_malaysianus.AAC.1